MKYVLTNPEGALFSHTIYDSLKSARTRRTQIIKGTAYRRGHPNAVIQVREFIAGEVIEDVEQS